MQSPQAAAECKWKGDQLDTPECKVQSPSPTPVCPSSPCAQQVENYALDAIPIPSELKQGPVMMELNELALQAE